MKTIVVIGNEMIGLFVDDGSLAIGTVLVFVVAVVAAIALHAPPLVTGAVLLIGSVGALCASVLRHGRSRPG